MEQDTSLKEKDPIKELLEIISRMRDPINGCPWDLEQTHSSLIPYLLEEAHEVVDAIRIDNDSELIEELGDLLLQIVLHAQIAEEKKRFSFNDIIKKLSLKLIRRHPHVFTNKRKLTSKQVKEEWEEIKLSEQTMPNSISPISDKLKIKIRSQPAIVGAMKISKKAAGEGFEWLNVNQVWEKYDEEVNEFKEALKQNNQVSAQEELGDVLFTLINIARWYGLNPEEGLAGTNKRFLERFSFMESNIKGPLSKTPIEKLDKLWQEAKKHLNVQKIIENNKSISNEI
tara:strand:+ start:320 stop:1174 length:855 start_codon:yes stop_codon:yes gene_type:complete